MKSLMSFVGSLKCTTLIILIIYINMLKYPVYMYALCIFVKYMQAKLLKQFLLNHLYELGTFIHVLLICKLQTKIP